MHAGFWASGRVSVPSLEEGMGVLANVCFVFLAQELIRRVTQVL